RLRAQLGLGHIVQTREVLVDLVNDRLDLLPFALVACAEDCVDDSLEHALLYRYNRSAAMNDATASGTNPPIDFPAFTRSRISVDEMSMRRDSSRRGAPGNDSSFGAAPSPARCSTTSVASSAIRSGSRHFANDWITSAPTNQNSCACGQSPERAVSVSTV